MFPVMCFLCFGLSLKEYADAMRPKSPRLPKPPKTFNNSINSTNGPGKGRYFGFRPQRVSIADIYTLT